MSYILITNSDGVSLSLGRAENEGAYLAHHGVKGQRWGVRRFQNPDGSLTEKGKRQIKTLQGKSDKLDAKKAKLNSPRKVNSKLDNRSKNRGELIRRMQQEQQQELQRMQQEQQHELQRIQMQMQQDQQQELQRIQMQMQQDQQQELQRIQMQMQQDQQQLINNYNATPMFF